MTTASRMRKSFMNLWKAWHTNPRSIKPRSDQRAPSSGRDSRPARGSTVKPFNLCLSLLVDSSSLRPLLLPSRLHQRSKLNSNLNREIELPSSANATAGRLQYDSWLETFLQTALPKHELVIRNLAFPGDTVDKRPRNKGFMAAEDYLKHVAADVIFVFFGYKRIVCRSGWGL